MTRYRWLELAAVVIVPAAALTALIAACVTDRVNPVKCSSNLTCAPHWLCVDDGQSCHPATCGDGYHDWGNGEVCDDGNAESGDGCSASCLSRESCGDGKKDPGEDCDPADRASDTACSMNCRIMAMCGNGFEDAGEECDAGKDGTRRATADCDADCTRPICGDRVVNEHFNSATDGREECDEGGINTATCDADCTIADCGDGATNTAAREDCDDGNHSNNDDCVECKPARCGDGHVRQRGDDVEECDDGNHSNDDGCVQGCKLAVCGDGYLWVGVEDCETNQIDTATCDADCTTARCGDGHLNRAAGEECEDGNHENDDDCPSGAGGTCQPAFCGDGFVHSQEECDDGNHLDFDDCPSGLEREGPRCQRATCGDRFIRSGVETCDNGPDDTVTCNGAGAPAATECRVPYCGDGYVNVAFGEECETDGHCNENQTCRAAGVTGECQCD
jgi:cysteine-rich repeat protein